MKENSKLKSILIAHRGESYDAPENTIAAINLAWLQNADGVEIDIHLTKDNEIVVIHDSKTKRTSGISMAVKSQTLEELKTVDAGSFKGEKWSGERIPTLREVLQTVPPEKFIFIEIKSGIEIIDALKTVLETSSLNNSQIKLIGFDLKIMSLLKKSFLEYEVFWCKRINREKIILTQHGWDRVIAIAKKNNFDGLNLSYSSCLTKKVVEKIKTNSLKLYVWTVNDPRRADKLIMYGVDGIMSDRTGWLRSKLNS